MASKYTKSCKGQPCQVRIPGICDGGGETTVGAHLNGAGMGRKALDIHIADACGPCHAWLDGGYAQKGEPRIKRDLWHLQAIIRTQERMVADGTLVL